MKKSIIQISTHVGDIRAILTLRMKLSKEHAQYYKLLLDFLKRKSIRKILELFMRLHPTKCVLDVKWFRLKKE